MKYYLLQSFGDFDVRTVHTLLVSESEININTLINSFKVFKKIKTIDHNMEDEFVSFCKKFYGMSVIKNIKMFTIDES